MKNWTKYKKAIEKEKEIKIIADTEFLRLFSIDDRVKYQRKTGGCICTGKILNHLCTPRRLYVTNVATGKMYWVEVFWLVEK
ncbi:hypothetical protein LCGC14_1006890 [marine sediment metagenome]|uniref:Uncharacterized protein n=1 Tax=marine sediment metagenome TaxID=412755 RepID=A0A0F9N1H2_9ZZZZ